MDRADLMRLFTDMYSEWRYFSNRKSHPSGVRAPTKKTAMLTSLGRLRGRGGREREGGREGGGGGKVYTPPHRIKKCVPTF